MSERVENIIQTIKQERRRFEVLCRSLSDGELARPVPDSTWIVRDFIAHLGTLDPELIRWFDGISRGNADETIRNADGQPWDINEFNDRVVAARREWPIDDVLMESETNRDRLIESLSKLTDENIDTVIHFMSDGKRPAADLPFSAFLSGWAYHDAVHVADMIKALPERADDPELRAWLEHPVVGWYQRAMAGPAAADEHQP